MNGDDSSQNDNEYTCLGCVEDTPAEYVWHDGLWESYYCPDHAQKQLPERGFDDYRATVIDNSGREGIVSGYVKPIGGSDKLVWADEIDTGTAEVRADGGRTSEVDQHSPVIHENGV